MNQSKTKSFARWMSMGWILVPITLTQGCATFTYPSPQPVVGDQIASIDPKVSGAQFGLSCPSSIRGTRSQIAFIVGEKVGFCFASPIVGDATHGNLSYIKPCAHGPIGGVRGETFGLIFQVYVRGKEVVLGVDQSLGTLETKGRTTTAKAQVQSRKFADMPPGTKVDGQLRYYVNGSWLSFAEASPHFSRIAYELVYVFDQACDPDADYRLSITGITIDGRAPHLPPVDFVPYSEIVPTFD